MQNTKHLLEEYIKGKDLLQQFKQKNAGSTILAIYKDRRLDVYLPRKYILG